MGRCVSISPPRPPQYGQIPYSSRASDRSRQGSRQQTGRKKSSLQKGASMAGSKGSKDLDSVHHGCCCSSAEFGFDKLCVNHCVEFWIR
jgi:hypothetical protein